MIGTLSSPSRDPGERSSVEAVLVPLSSSAPPPDAADVDLDKFPPSLASLYDGGAMAGKAAAAAAATSGEDAPFTGSSG